MLLVASFPGISKARIYFDKLVTISENSQTENLKKMGDARAYVVGSIRSDLPTDLMITSLDSYIHYLLEYSSYLSSNNCIPPKHSWISSILKTEDRIDCLENSMHH